MPQVISAETLQAFNNTAAEFKGGGQKPHYTVGSLIYWSPAVWEPPFVLKKEEVGNLWEAARREQGAGKWGCPPDKYGL